VDTSARAYRAALARIEARRLQLVEDLDQAARVGLDRVELDAVMVVAGVRSDPRVDPLTR
jgi:hypothetical protein